MHSRYHVVCASTKDDELFPDPFVCNFNCSYATKESGECPCFSPFCSTANAAPGSDADSVSDEELAEGLRYKQVRPRCLRVIKHYCDGCTLGSCHDDQCVTGANRWALRRHHIGTVGVQGGRIQDGDMPTRGGRSVALDIPALSLAGELARMGGIGDAGEGLSCVLYLL